MADQKLGCKSCGIVVSFKDLRADKTGKGWICVECYNKQHKKPATTPNVTERLKEMHRMDTKVMINQTQQPQLVKGQKLHLKCFSCGYKFEIVPEGMKKMCPYCGKKDTLERVKTAQEILVESEHF